MARIQRPHFYFILAALIVFNFDQLPEDNISTTKFLEYQIIRGYPFNRTFLEDYRSCDGPDREELHENFQKPGILDFHTVIHTNLHILYIGSSIAMQLSQGFQEATQSAKREVIRYVRYRLLDMHENTHITRTEDGGTVGALRLTGLFEHRTRDKKRWVAPQGGGGWFSSDVREMKRMIHQWREQDSLVGKANSNSSCEVVNDESVDNRTVSEMILCEQENFDALVYQIPVEWLPEHKKVVPLEYFERFTSLAFDESGVETIILETVPIVKQGITNISQIIATNENVWTFAREFNDRNSRDKTNLESTMDETPSNDVMSNKKVLVMDVFSYSVSMCLENAMNNEMIPLSIGTNIKNNLEQADDFQAYLNYAKEIDDALKENNGGVLDSSTIKNAFMCSEKACKTKSRLTYDALHWCMKETSGRMNAALACLLKCTLKKEGVLRDCERHCNTQYMSLKPIPWKDAKEVMVKMTGLQGHRHL